jgi:hypothetical protein
MILGLNPSHSQRKNELQNSRILALAHDEITDPAELVNRGAD